MTTILVLQGDTAYWTRWRRGRCIAHFEESPDAEKVLQSDCPWLGSQPSTVRVVMSLAAVSVEFQRAVHPPFPHSLGLRRFFREQPIEDPFTRAHGIPRRIQQRLTAIRSASYSVDVPDFPDEVSGSSQTLEKLAVRISIPDRWMQWLSALSARQIIVETLCSAAELMAHTRQPSSLQRARQAEAKLEVLAGGSQVQHVLSLGHTLLWVRSLDRSSENQLCTDALETLSQIRTEYPLLHDVSMRSVGLARSEARAIDGALGLSISAQEPEGDLPASRSSAVTSNPDPALARLPSHDEQHLAALGTCPVAEHEIRPSPEYLAGCMAGMGRWRASRLGLLRSHPLLQSWQMRRRLIGLQMVTATTAVVACTTVAVAVLQGLDNRTERVRHQQSKAHLNKAISSLRQEARALFDDAEYLASTATRFERFAHSQTMEPAELLWQLAQVYSARPKLTLDALSWQLHESVEPWQDGAVRDDVGSRLAQPTPRQHLPDRHPSAMEVRLHGEVAFNSASELNQRFIEFQSELRQLPEVQQLLVAQSPLAALEAGAESVDDSDRTTASLAPYRVTLWMAAESGDD